MQMMMSMAGVSEDTSRMSMDEMAQFQRILEHGDEDEDPTGFDPSFHVPEEAPAKRAGTRNLTRPSVAQQAQNYPLRMATFQGKQTSMICQNGTGACALVAICNALLLQDRLRSKTSGMISSEALILMLSEMIFSDNSHMLTGDARRQYEHDVASVVEIMPKLPYEMELDVRFHGVKQFDYFSSNTIFDLFDINLYHGWLVDPQDVDSNIALEEFSHKQAVAFVASCEAGGEDESFGSPMEALQSLHRGEAVSRFLQATEGQLTAYGLSQLLSTMKDMELGILYRCGQFDVICKRANRLYMLYSAPGAADSRVVWESLTLQGSPQRFDGNFQAIQPGQEHMSSMASATATMSQTVSDEEFARRLQEEEALHAIREQRQSDQRHANSSNPDYITVEDARAPPAYAAPQVSHMSPQVRTDAVAVTNVDAHVTTLTPTRRSVVNVAGLETAPRPTPQFMYGEFNERQGSAPVLNPDALAPPPKKGCCVLV